MSFNKRIDFVKKGFGQTSDLIKKGFGFVDTTAKRLNKISGGALGKLVEYNPALSSISSMYKDARMIGLGGANILGEISQELGDIKRPQQLASAFGLGQEYKKASEIFKTGKETIKDIKAGKFSKSLEGIERLQEQGSELEKMVRPGVQKQLMNIYMR